MQHYPVQGLYGKVSLVESVQNLESDQTVELKSDGFLGRLGFGKRPKAAYYASNVAENIFNRGLVGLDEISAMPRGKNPSEQQDLATILITLSNAYKRRFPEVKPGSTYDLGKYLSDFIEVIPIEVGSRIIYNAGNPTLAQDIGEGKVMVGGISIDMGPQGDANTVELAVEIIAMLPEEKRYELFAELSKMDPSQEGRANALFRLIAMNMSQRDSPYSGTMLIYKNLEGEEAGSKAKELVAHLQELGKLVRQFFDPT